MNDVRFLVMFRSEVGERLAQIVLESLRAFGGPLRDSQVWAFVLDPDRVSHVLPGLEGVHRLPLTIEKPKRCTPVPKPRLWRDRRSARWCG